MKACDQNIKKTLKITEEMIKLAFKGDADREDIGCGILYGILLNSAYKIKKIAEEEKQAHVNKAKVKTENKTLKGKKKPRIKQKSLYLDTLMTLPVICAKDKS